MQEPIQLHKRGSLSQSLTKTVITGSVFEKKKSQDFSKSHDNDLVDMYVEEILQTGEKM